MSDTPPKPPYPRSTYLLIGVLAAGLVLTAVVGLTALRSSAQINDGSSIVENASVYAGTSYDPPIQLDDFTLAASTGEMLSLSDLRGRYVLLFFGFTHCPDVCPLTLAEFKRVKAILGGAAQNVVFLFISVDSPRDTPQVIADYLARFDADFIGMTADDETLQRIGSQYNLFYELPTNADSLGGYAVDHTGRSYVIDPVGQLRISYSYGTEAEIIAAGIQELMWNA